VRKLLTCLSLALVAGCGLPRMSPADQMVSTYQQTRDLAGSYLSLGFEPADDLVAELNRLRLGLGFVGMDRAIPPRDPDHLHVTVGFFRSLMPYQAERMRARFQGQAVHVRLTGTGVVRDQVAYCTVEGVEPLRAWLREQQIPFEADDAHCTFGVHPGNPRDVHRVPKPLQQPMTVRQVLTEIHLCQGKRALW